MVFDKKRLEPSEFPWQRHFGCHLVSSVTYISGAKFEEHRFNISRDILYSVFCHFCCKPHDVITFLILHNTKTLISLKRKKIFQKGNTILLYFEKPFKYAVILFHVVGISKRCHTPCIISLLLRFLLKLNNNSSSSKKGTLTVFSFDCNYQNSFRFPLLFK